MNLSSCTHMLLTIACHIVSKKLVSEAMTMREEETGKSSCSVRDALYILGTILAWVGIGFGIVGFVSGYADRGGLGSGEYSRWILIAIPLFIGGRMLMKFGHAHKANRYADDEDEASD